MSVQLQHRRGTTAQHATFTGAAGEFTMDTTKNTVVVHDGATAGGFPLAKFTDLQTAVATTANAGGTANVITASFAPAILALTNGMTVLVRAATANTTTTPTLQANATAAKTIVKGSNQLLEPGDIAGVGHWLQLTYDSSLDRWVLDNPARAVVVNGTYAVRGLAGANNVTTPNTQMDLLADQAVLRNPLTGGVLVKNNITTLTNNILTAGPAANGRDQAGAFAASNWIQFYFICDAAGNVATLSSLVPPPNAPTLPAGYTHWAYIGAVFYTGSSQLARVRMRGHDFYYDATGSALVAGTAISETAVVLSSLVPPNAVATRLRCVFTDATGAGVSHNAVLRVSSGNNFFVFDQASTAAIRNSCEVNVPNVGQQVLYILSVNTTSLDLGVTGYTVPNGG